MRAPVRTPWDQPPGPGQAITVAPGVLWMRLPLPMKLDHVNVYALDDGAAGWTVVDTGMASGRTRAHWQALRDGPMGGRPVHRILATHHHPDHIGLAGWFMQQDGASLMTSRTAWLMARMLVLDVQDRPAPETLAFWRSAGMDPALLARRQNERPFDFADVVAPLPPGFTRLAQGERVVLGGRTWDVHTGEGHAPEHLTLWSRDDDLVLGGDQLLASISPNLGVYATQPDADPVGDWLASSGRMAALAQDRHLVLPGHKLPFTGLPERLRQMTDNHLSALARLSAALAVAPRTAAGCFDILYRRPIADAEYGLALVEAVAHVNHLRLDGRIRQVGQDGTGAALWGA